MIFKEAVGHTSSETKILKVSGLGIQQSNGMHKGRRKCQSSSESRNLASISERKDIGLKNYQKRNKLLIQANRFADWITVHRTS